MPMQRLAQLMRRRRMTIGKTAMAMAMRMQALATQLLQVDLALGDGRVLRV